MMEYSAYYDTKLYPLQDEVLKKLKSSGQPFCLTGGTAVSRGYFHHRYSDDLDLFANNTDGFLDWRDVIEGANEKEAGIDLKEVVQIFNSCSEKDLMGIKWTKSSDLNRLKEIVTTVSSDMLTQSDNSLCMNR